MTVNLVESRIAWKKACQHAADTGRSTCCGWYHSLTGTMDCVLGKKVEQISDSLFLTLDGMCPAASGSCSLDSPVMMDSTLEL